MMALAFVLANDGLDLLAWAYGGLGLIHSAHGGISPAAFAAWGLEASLKMQERCCENQHPANATQTAAAFGLRGDDDC